jgi:hypothetical protein
MCVCRTFTIPKTLIEVCDLRLSLLPKHSDDHKTLPHRTDQQPARVKLNHIPDLNDGHFEWFMDEFEGFTRRQELERAILKSADLLEKGEYDPVEKLIKDAVQIA